MTFKAYLDNIEAKTGKSADDFRRLAEKRKFMQNGTLRSGVKAGDIVIQRGTNHAWSNRSGKPVRMLYILIDGRFDPELAAQFTKRGE